VDLDASTIVIGALIVGVAMAAVACFIAVAIARQGGTKQARSMLIASLVVLVVSLFVAVTFQLLIWNAN
jgi:hypothetical protein